MRPKPTRLLLWGAGVVGAVVLVATAAFCREWSEAQRDRWLQPERVMDAVGVRAGMRIGEVGAGEGYFTVKLARRVGEGGRVYANDISARRLENLAERAADEKLGNIVTVFGEEEDPLFPENALDMVFFVYALHDIDEPVALLRNLKGYLGVDATVVVLDQNPTASGDTHFLPFESVRGLLEEAGYELVQREEFLERDLLCVFRVQPGDQRPPGLL